jgi:hypothetical protein
MPFPANIHIVDLTGLMSANPIRDRFGIVDDPNIATGNFWGTKLEPGLAVGVYLLDLVFQFTTTVRGGEVVGAEPVVGIAAARKPFPSAVTSYLK